MFEKRIKNDEKNSPSGANLGDKTISEEERESVKEILEDPNGKKEGDEPIEIHSMPRKFHDGTKKKEGKKNKFLFIGIIVIAVLVLGVIAAFLFQRIMGPNAENSNKSTSTQTTNGNENINSAGQNTNKNLNENANQNANENLNTNLNINTNANQNLNLNANLNTNINQNVNLNVSTPIPDSVDSDRDGLTDKEEETYGTEVKKPDTDSDSYLDGTELVSGYDPLSSGKLVSSSFINIYTNQDFNYSVLYPKSWPAQPTSADNKEILFAADTAEFIEVLVANNPSSLTVEEWFLNQFPDMTNQDLTSITTWKNQEGILSPEGNTVYLATGSYIYLISYNTGTKQEANFRKTFEMMYKSFEIIPKGETNTNTNTNANTNTNTNTNLNANQNINSNLNTNVNQNQNLNLNNNSNNNSNSNNSNNNTNTNSNSNSNSDSNSSSLL